METTSSFWYLLLRLRINLSSGTHYRQKTNVYRATSMDISADFGRYACAETSQNFQLTQNQARCEIPHCFDTKSPSNKAAARTIAALLKLPVA